MSGRRPFSELTKDFTPERRQRIEAKKAELRAAMPLHELRQAQVMTQKALGETLAVNQPAIAKMERRTDMYVSTLRFLHRSPRRTAEDRRRVPRGRSRNNQLLGRGQRRKRS